MERVLRRVSKPGALELELGSAPRIGRHTWLHGVERSIVSEKVSHHHCDTRYSLYRVIVRIAPGINVTYPSTGAHIGSPEGKRTGMLFSCLPQELHVSVCGGFMCHVPQLGQSFI